MLAIAAWGKPIELWEVATARRRATIHGDTDAGTCISLSPNGRYLAAGGGPDKPTIRIWQLPSGKMIAKFHGHKDWLKRVAWAPDSSKLLSCGGDTTAYVWDVAAAIRAISPIVEKDLDGEILDNAIISLGDPDPAKAWAAMKTLAARPDEATKALAQAIKVLEEAPNGSTDAATITKLIKNLDAEVFADREAAAEQLAKLGEAAGPAMRDALRTAVSDETRGRLTILLGRLADRGPTSPDALRARRGIELLERIATPEAQDVLEKLAKQRPGSVVSGLAKKAVGRLSGR
jgi:hypothetical protein